MCPSYNSSNRRSVRVTTKKRWVAILILIPLFPNQMVVGARDTLYKLSLDHLKQLQKTEWKASAESANLCTAKGQSEEDCHNYVKVLVSLQNRIFACATHAFDPKCSWR